MKRPFRIRQTSTTEYVVLAESAEDAENYLDSGLVYDEEFIGFEVESVTELIGETAADYDSNYAVDDDE